MTVLLTRLAVLQGAIEDTYNTAASVGVNDGFLVSNPTYTVKPNVLERDYVREDLSPLAFVIGRKLAGMEFETELRGNGLQNAGTAASAAIITRLFQACGYALTPNVGPCVKGPFDQGDPAIEVSWAISSQATASQTFTASANFQDGDTMTIDGVTYRMKTTPAAANDVKIGTSDTVSLANIMAAITGGAGSGTLYYAGTTVAPDVTATSTTTTLVVTANRFGLWGNSIGVSYTATGASAGTWASTHLSGGADPADNTDVIAYYLTVSTGGRIRFGADHHHLGYDRRERRGDDRHLGFVPQRRNEGPDPHANLDGQPRARPGVDGVAHAAGHQPRSDLERFREHHALPAQRRRPA